MVSSDKVLGYSKATAKSHPATPSGRSPIVSIRQGNVGLPNHDRNVSSIIGRTSKPKSLTA